MYWLPYAVVSVLEVLLLMAFLMEKAKLSVKRRYLATKNYLAEFGGDPDKPRWMIYRLEDILDGKEKVSYFESDCEDNCRRILLHFERYISDDDLTHLRIEDFGG